MVSGQPFLQGACLPDADHGPESAAVGRKFDEAMLVRHCQAQEFMSKLDHLGHHPLSALVPWGYRLPEECQCVRFQSPDRVWAQPTGQLSKPIHVHLHEQLRNRKLCRTLKRNKNVLDNSSNDVIQQLFKEIDINNKGEIKYNEILAAAANKEILLNDE